MANYQAVDIEIGEPEGPAVEEPPKILKRRLLWIFTFFTAFCFFGFCTFEGFFKPFAMKVFKPSTSLLSKNAQWVECAYFSQAQCCDCGSDQQLVAGQCWKGNSYEGMSTCARGCCLPGYIDVPECVPVDIAAGIAAGAIVGVTIVGGTLLIIGLGPLGPVAGGLFATAQGAAIAAGSLMAIIQSGAMTGIAYGTGAAAGAAAGVAIGTISCLG